MTSAVGDNKTVVERVTDVHMLCKLEPVSEIGFTKEIPAFGLVSSTPQGSLANLIVRHLYL